ncbi:hypothetical protein [Marinovum sp.]|uniref:hypothetical protein n=1 Tax=Marinovum sp. TaxID=2024839 RepID=UPI003A8DDD3D
MPVVPFTVLPAPRLLACLAALALPLPGMAQQAEFLYQTPAAIDDFPEAPDKQAQLLTLWNQFMPAFVDMAITGNPWTSEHDAPRPNFVDYASIPDDAQEVVQPITWTAFPNKVTWYFHTSQNNPFKLDGALVYPLADEGRLLRDSLPMQRWLDISGEATRKNLDEVLDLHPEFASTDLSVFAPVKIPTDICPLVNWAQDADGWQLYSERVSGPRGWKDEYNEWVVERNAEGDIIAANFTAENPEYWFTLWEVDPQKVLALYRELTGRDVQIEDLQLQDKAGFPIADANGKPAYNPLNKWNYGNHASDEGGGAIHLTSPPNTVGAEIYLGGAATILRDLGDQDYSPANTICASRYGGSFRNSDPNIGMQANQVTRNIKLRLTLTNPIGLYMQTPDFSNYVTPDGTDAREFFHILRGRTAEEAGQAYDQILHARFEVPADKGYTVSDIKINGTPILWGSQIAETFNQALAATAFADLPVVDDTLYPPVPVDGKPGPTNGAAQPLVAKAVLAAVQDTPALSAATIPLLPMVVAPGHELTEVMLMVENGAEAAEITYADAAGTKVEGIRVEVVAATPAADSKPDDFGIYEDITYELKIFVKSDVPPGRYGVRVSNPGVPEQVPAPANLIVLDVN